MEGLLLAWFSRNGRDLPWRKTRDPYAILVSEVMSQQYRVKNEELPAMQAFSA
jgi:A/G-specific adenine glycosylase